LLDDPKAHWGGGGGGNQAIDLTLFSTRVICFLLYFLFLSKSVKDKKNYVLDFYYDPQYLKYEIVAQKISNTDLCVLCFKNNNHANSIYLDMREETCYAIYHRGRCDVPFDVPLTRSACCCSVGAAWGIQCRQCPQKNTRNVTSNMH